LLEWDDQIPSFDEVHAEALKAEKYLRAPSVSVAPGSTAFTRVFLGPRSADKLRDRVDCRLTALTQQLLWEEYRQANPDG